MANWQIGYLDLKVLGLAFDVVGYTSSQVCYQANPLLASGLIKSLVRTQFDRIRTRVRIAVMCNKSSSNIRNKYSTPERFDQKFGSNSI